jgi:hypothetical protein
MSAEEKIVEAVLEYFGPHAGHGMVRQSEDELLWELERLAHDCEMERSEQRTWRHLLRAQGGAS